MTIRGADGQVIPGAVQIPEFTRGDRLRKARLVTGMNTHQFAEHIGVAQKTVSDAENDKRALRKILLNAWALGTGVPAEWLETGVVHGGGGDGGDGGTPTTHR